jgi:AraC family transcriptional regulator
MGFDEFEATWKAQFSWMNEKGYKKRSEFPYEIYHSNFKEHPEGKMNVELCIPIL